MICILNHSPLPLQEARISVEDRGFRFGDGVFETIRVEKGAPYRFDWHLARLSRGLAALSIRCNIALIAQDCRKIIVENNVIQGLLRVQVTRGAGSRGYLPDESHPDAGATVLVETRPIPPVATQTVELWMSTYERVSPKALPAGIKLCQGMNSTLARMEAQKNDCFDALQLNYEGMLCETSSANLFWLKDNVLYTPSLACGPVEGSLRACLQEVSPYPVQECAAALDELRNAEAVCITNVAWLVLPVNVLKPLQWRWQSDTLSAQLGALVTQDIQFRCTQLDT